MLRHLSRAAQAISRSSSSVAVRCAATGPPGDAPNRLMRALGWGTGLSASWAWLMYLDVPCSVLGNAPNQSMLPWALTMALADSGPAPTPPLQPSPTPTSAAKDDDEDNGPCTPSGPASTPSLSEQTRQGSLAGCGKAMPMDIAALRPYEGHWLVIFRSPGSMERFFDLFMVSPWLQWIAKHVPGYQLEVDERLGVLRLSILSPVPFIKLTETYRLDGAELNSRRRDFRQGVQQGRLELDQGCLRLHLRWGDPLPGYATDVLRLTSPDTLVMTSEAHLDAPGPVRHLQGQGEKPPLSAEFRCLCRRDPPIGTM